MLVKVKTAAHAVVNGLRMQLESGWIYMCVWNYMPMLASGSVCVDASRNKVSRCFHNVYSGLWIISQVGNSQPAIVTWISKYYVCMYVCIHTSVISFYEAVLMYSKSVATCTVLNSVHDFQNVYVHSKSHARCIYSRNLSHSHAIWPQYM